MSTVKTIVLEVLRDGPSHNQLLSPLTLYLAACQNRPPESLRLGVEHHEFLRWQGGLTYADTAVRPSPEASTRDERKRGRVPGTRRDSIVDATEAVTKVLGSVRALTAELASEPCEWRHIHLVLDAAELGALPFELAHAAPGLMVEGERLFLQQNARVTLTRQTRRLATSVVDWPNRPRILCVVADGDLPTDAHVLALRQSIDPWIGWNDGDSSEIVEMSDADEENYRRGLLTNRMREAEQMLTVLLNPTLDDVSREARRVPYTHIHVLGHGAPLNDVGPAQTLYGLCFRGVRGDVDVVDGDRLEAALRHSKDCCHPTVVTLATCEGASVSGAILGPGGSVAHALHAKGIPLVIAAQFPLSKGASAIFAEMLYSGLLRGEDPRQVVHAIRRELLVSYPETHDWASLVVYGSFPSDLDDQLERVKRSAEKLAVETAVERLRVTLRRYRRGSKATPLPSPDPATTASNADQIALKEKQEALLKRLEKDADRLDRANQAIESWTDGARSTARRVKGYLLQARIAMRVWDILVPVRQSEKASSEPESTLSISDMLGRKSRHDDLTGRRQISMLSPSDLLETARDAYTNVYALDGARPEAWVQVAFLEWLRMNLYGRLGADPVEDKALSSAFNEGFAEDLQSLREMVFKRSAIQEKLGGTDRDVRSLNAATIFEITLLSRYLIPDFQRTETELDEAFRMFVEAATPISTSYRAHAVWRQLLRYERLKSPHRATPGRYRAQLERMGVRKYWGPRP